MEQKYYDHIILKPQLLNCMYIVHCRFVFIVLLGNTEGYDGIIIIQSTISYQIQSQLMQY